MIKLENQPFSLQRCIEESIDLGAENRANKGLELEYRIKENVPSTVLDDFSMLCQILVNLISNAVKFTERGCISITVFGRKKEGDRYEIHFPVKDTGIAIPEDKADRLSMLSASILDGSEVCSAYLWSFAGTSIHMLEEKLPGENATKIRALYKSSTGYEA